MENKKGKIGKIGIGTTTPESMMEFSNEGKTCLKIERDGVIKWYPNGKEEVCEDFKDLAKGFMFVLLTLAPQTDWEGLAPEIYDEIKHLIKE